MPAMRSRQWEKMRSGATAAIHTQKCDRARGRKCDRAQQQRYITPKCDRARGRKCDRPVGVRHPPIIGSPPKKFISPCPGPKLLRSGRSESGYHSYLAPLSTRGRASRIRSQAEPRNEGKKLFIGLSVGFNPL